MLKRILACALSGALAFSLLTGCTAPAADSSAETNYGTTIPAAAEADVDSYLTNGAISCDDTVMTVNGVDIPASAYFYWMAYYAGYLEYYYQSQGGSGASFSLSQQYDDKTTYGEYVQQQTEKSLISSVVTAQKAKKDKVALSDEAQSALDQLPQSTDSNTLLYYATDLDGMEFNYTNYYYSQALQSALFDKGGKYYANKKTLSDYYKDNVFGAKHILIMTTNMTDEQKVKAKKTIEGYLKTILKSDDPASTFNQYMNEHSEDSGLKTYPDGYTYMRGDMATEFEDAVASLKVNEIDPQIVETSYGYHIIMRIEPDKDAIDQDTLKKDYKNDVYSSLLEDWSANVTSTTADSLKKVDVDAFYEKLTALQGIIDTITQASADASTSAAAASQQTAQ